MQERAIDKTKIEKPTLVEVGGEPVGVAIAHDGGYRFLAVKLPAFAIDGQIFATVESARAAVLKAVTDAGREAV